MNARLVTVAAIAMAIGMGLGLRFVVGLEPVWWLAWFLPGLLLALALRAGNWEARGLVALSAAIGVSVNLPFFLEVMPPMPAIIVTLLQVLLWVLVIGTARRIVLATASAWTVIALPVVGVAADTLLAHFTPDGNWGSLAYTQADVAPIAQLASLFGAGGILFLLLLVNSALALALHRGWRARGVAPACAVTIVAVLAAATFGWWRLQAPASGPGVTFGIASIDDFIPGTPTELARRVWARYDEQVAELAGRGAKVVLLPEKIAVLPGAAAQARKEGLAQLAAAHRVWLVAGVGVDDGRERRNEAWFFGPDGQLEVNYLKRFMAPPEREFVAGHESPVLDVEGVRYGVAICKDMHFGSLGRDFGERDAAVMLVPAWDFDLDARYAAYLTKLRGVENGYTIVRASRNGLLTVTDAYGAVRAEQRSAPLPGATLLAEVPVGPRVATLYTSIGDAAGWLSVAAAAVLLPWSVRRRR